MLIESQRTRILQFDTCKIANALEHLRIRLNNQGYTRPGLHCATGACSAFLGYAFTSRVKTADPPMKGSRSPDLHGWWEWIASLPSPKISVMQDVDSHPGQGAVLSDVHAEILRALGCHALITNGAVRNIPGLAAMQFGAFSQSVAVSHSYAHIVDFGVPVDILGLRVRTGDLVYVDVHGAMLLPEEAVEDILRVAQEQAARERTVIDLCRSQHFSLPDLMSALASLRELS